MEDPIKRPEKIKLTEINPYLTCYLCKGYLIDATTISECLHSFCRSCIIKFLQDNSYCPICEVIINKAKPNLKLDKTLQDIVYKLVPELFLREMTRRKQYYLQYPQIAARVSPEERGEDTERTIFNPQDFISLSMEYVSADSSPGAIKILTSKNDSDKNDQLSLEENQALMKRYLQCPGMCRIDVLKKFVRNKYNVDTSLFHIDILYKRVPLPDHYTLIDIAYIYSWKRNEPMKFFFRITDINKLSERFDYFDSEKSSELIVQLPVKTPRNNGSSKRKEYVSNKKKNKQELQNQANGCDKQKNEGIANEPNRSENSPCDKLKVDEQKLNGNKENVKVKNAETSDKSPKRFILKIKKDPEKDKLKHTDNSSGFKVSVTSVEPEVSKHKVQNKQNVYTNITLNRTNNMEIITKIQKVSNKGRPIELNVLEQTVKCDELATNSEKSLPMLKPDSDTKNTKNLTEDEEKIRFLETFQLAAKNSIPKKVPQKSPTIDINKRKPISPLKSVSPKKSKVDKKPVTRIILQTKPKQTEKCQRPGLQTLIENCKIPSSLSITIKDGVENNKSTPLIPPVKNYIEILKLPEENSNDKCNGVNNNNKLNFSLRMNDDSEQKVDEDLAEIAKSLTEKIPMSTTVSQIVGPKPEFPIPVKTNVPSKFNVPPVLNVPKDTKLPRPLQSFQKIFEESIKKPESTSVENDVQKPVDSSNEVTSSTSSNKRNILEIASQLFKKTKLEVDKNQVNSTTTSTPKVAIPRLTSQRPLKDQQTKANLHSNALGLNYTISVGPDISSKANGLTPNSKKEEIKTAEIKPASPKPTSLLTNISQNLGLNSPKNSPKHSPKSSPMIKHMYAAVPDTFSPKLPSPKVNNISKRLSGTSSPQPSSTASPPQIQVPSKTNTKAGSSKQASPLSPNQILEIYNIQNLAQLTASLNFNSANYGLSSGNQLAAYQHAMLLKHFEMQNRQNWLNMNQGSLLQYEKYLQNLQNLKSAQNQLLSNIKEN